jgi:CBS domain-containing protein
MAVRDGMGRDEAAPHRPRSLPRVAGDVMRGHFAAASPETPAADVRAVMERERLDLIPVVDGEGRGRLLGAVLRRDLGAAAAGNGDHPPVGPRAADLARAGFTCTTTLEPLERVLDQMAGARVAVLPVVDPDFRLTGVVALDDVAALAPYARSAAHVRRRIGGPLPFWLRRGRL